MDALIVIVSVMMTEHFLSVYAFGILRTKSLILPNKPERWIGEYPQNSNFYSAEKSKWRHLPDRSEMIHANKRFFEFHPVAFNKNKAHHQTNEGNTKRLFQYSPLVTAFVNLRNKKFPATSSQKFKSFFVGKSTTPANVKPFVDHFSGVKAWALPFYNLKHKGLGDKNQDSDTIPDDEANNNNLLVTDENDVNSMFKEYIETTTVPSIHTNLLSQSVNQRKKGLEVLEAFLKSDVLKLNERSKWNERDTTKPTLSSLYYDNGDTYLNDATTMSTLEKKLLDKLINSEDEHAVYNVGHNENFGSFGYDSDSHRSSPDKELSSVDWTGEPNQKASTTNITAYVRDSDEDKSFEQMNFDMNDAPMSFGFGSFVDNMAETENNHESFGSFGKDSDSKPNFGLDIPVEKDDNGFQDIGAFSIDDTDCNGVDNKPCFHDSECSCYGFYFCVEGACTSVMTMDIEYDSEAPSTGFWHDTPVDTH